MKRILQSAPLLKLILIVLASLGESEASSQPRKGVCVGVPRVPEIQQQAAEIDQAFDAPPSSSWRHLEKQTSRWQFSGLIQNDAPVFLSGEFSEGELARRESYYFSHGELILVVVDRSWDVDDPRKAPEPEKVQEFYIDQVQSVCAIRRTLSKPPVTHFDPESHPAGNFVERAHRIATILFTKSPAETKALTLPLREFPDSQMGPESAVQPNQPK